MGLFGSIGKAFKKATRFVGKTVTGTVHGVAKGVHSVLNPIVNTTKKVLNVVGKVPVVGDAMKSIGNAKVFGVSINDGLKGVEKINRLAGRVSDLTAPNRSIGQRFQTGKSIYREFKKK